MVYITDIYDNLQIGKPWFTLFAIEAYMESQKIKLTPKIQVKALKDFQKKYQFDILFPRMDLDEYVEIVSNIEGIKRNISKSQDWGQFEPKDILRLPSSDQITRSSTYQVLKQIQANNGKPFKYIGGYIPGPYTLVSLILELQAASELVIYDPEFLKSLVEFSLSIITQYSKMLSPFVDSFFILAPSECTIMKRSYISIVQESMNNLIKYCAKKLHKPTLIHFCAKKTSQVVNDEVIEPMKDAGIMGLNIPNIIESIEYARKYDLILCGGIDPVNIQVEPKQKTIKGLKEILHATKDIQYIFSTNCQVKWAPGQISSADLLNIFHDIRNIL